MLPNKELNALRERFAIPGVASIEPGEGGLPKVSIHTPVASAEIYLHGAQVTSWKPAGFEEVLFLSKQSQWKEGHAIRGGVPLCYLWFRNMANEPKAPSHGTVRTKAWELVSLAQQQDAIVVELATTSDEASRTWWPHEFRVVHRITVGRELRMELTTANAGTTPFQLEEALHTYFHVGDAEQAQVAGLDGVTYFDNVHGNAEKVQSGNVTFSGPLDNAYFHTQSALELIDPVLRRRIRTEKENSQSTVVWNPWKEGAQSMADLGDDEWKQMVCVEASNIRSAAVTVAPGGEHRFAAVISVAAD